MDSGHGVLQVPWTSAADYDCGAPDFEVGPGRREAGVRGSALGSLFQVPPLSLPAGSGACCSACSVAGDPPSPLTPGGGGGWKRTTNYAAPDLFWRSL